MKKRKTIEQIYMETKDFDLILTHDPALADALNRRIDRPRIGPFAETVKHYIIKKTRYTDSFPLLDEQTIINELSGIVGNFQKARYYLSLMEDCYNKMSEIDSVLVPLPEFIEIPCLLYTSPSPRDLSTSRMPSSA